MAESNNSSSEVSGLGSIKEEKKESSGSDSRESSGFKNYSFHKNWANAKSII